MVWYPILFRPSASFFAGNNGRKNGGGYCEGINRRRVRGFATTTTVLSIRLILLNWHTFKVFLVVLGVSIGFLGVLALRLFCHGGWFSRGFSSCRPRRGFTRLRLWRIWISSFKVILSNCCLHWHTSKFNHSRSTGSSFGFVFHLLLLLPHRCTRWMFPLFAGNALRLF